MGNETEQNEIQEAKNAYAAYEKLQKINPYSMNDLKTFHGIMTKYVVEDSGDFRRGEEGVFMAGIIQQATENVSLN